MSRALLLFILPCATLLANLPAPGRSYLGTREPLALAALPAAPALAPASELDRVRAAAGNGDLEAQARLGGMYYWGQGAPMDWAQAQVWLRKAAERGSASAQAKLGAMCFLGQGAPQDPVEAVKWFRRAAEQGEAYAQGCMGVMYAVGLSPSVPRDLVQAYVWLAQAEAGGDTDASAPLEQVRNNLTPAQLQEAQRRAGQAVRSRSGN